MTKKVFFGIICLHRVESVNSSPVTSTLFLLCQQSGGEFSVTKVEVAGRDASEP